MANMIVASYKVPISSSPSSPIPKPRITFQISIPKIPSNLSSSFFFAIASASLALAPPSMVEEFEKAALFDFDLTLPIQMVQFLLLMVALNKLYYSPLRKFMDERDLAIREKLGSVKDTSEEVKQLEEQGIAIMRDGEGGDIGGADEDEEGDAGRGGGEIGGGEEEGGCGAKGGGSNKARVSSSIGRVLVV